MFAGKKFSTEEEVIAETETCFETTDKSYCKYGIENLYDRFNRCIATILNSIIKYYEKNIFLLR